MSNGTEPDRLDAVRELLEFSQPLEAIAARLSGFGWDYEGVGVEMTRAHLASVLRRFLLGELSAADVEGWANLIELREDVEFEVSSHALLKEAIHDLANPALTQVIGREFVRELLGGLGAQARPSPSAPEKALLPLPTGEGF